MDALGDLDRCYERETALKYFLWGFSFLLSFKQTLQERVQFRVIGINNSFRGIKIEIRENSDEVKVVSHTNKILNMKGDMLK